MTTTASKYGLRAAAKERQTKHAQRTALPARPGEVEEARDLGVGADSSPRYGEMTVAQLKAEAKSLGIVTYTLRTKGSLLNALLARLQTTPAQEARAEAKVDATFSGPQPGDAIGNAEVGARNLAIGAEMAGRKPQRKNNAQDRRLNAGTSMQEQAAEVSASPSKSDSKARAFSGKAEALGWTTTLRDSQTLEDRVLCVATRSASGGPVETITIEWLDGVFNNQTCFHTTPGGRALKLRNASHALKRMALQPVDVVREDTKVGIHTTARAARRSAGSDQQGASHAPYFAEDVSDAEVLASITDKTITWVNGISGALETDKVNRTSPTGTIQLKHPTSGRAVTFLGSAGFRTVRVSSIVSL